MGEAYRRRDVRGVVLALLPRSPATLTASQIMARGGLSGALALRHLAAREAEGLVGKIAGKSRRWHQRNGGDATA